MRESAPLRDSAICCCETAMRSVPNSDSGWDLRSYVPNDSTMQTSEPGEAGEMAAHFGIAALR